MTDISIILNVHNEAIYLQRTYLSTVDAVDYAKSAGLTFEIIVVVDRPDGNTSEWVRRQDFGEIGPATVLTVDYGSLAKSRQAGLEAATGVYVATADADDLISFNYFEATHSTLERSPANTVSTQEWLVGFGASEHLWKYIGSADGSSTLAPFSVNPFTSRIVARRTDLARFGYRHPDSKRGEAFEDWDLNARLIAAGFKWHPAKNTVLFYRQRSSGIMGALRGVERHIPCSDYFVPKTFLRATALDIQRHQLARTVEPPSAEAVRMEALQRQELLEIFAAANQIEHSIRYERIPHIPAGTNLGGQLSLGPSYHNVCTLVGDQSFTDVVLLPYISNGGGEKFIIDVISGLTKLNPKRRFLVLAGEPFTLEHRVDKLPDNCQFVNLWKECTAEAVLPAAFRIIQATAAGATIHLKSSGFAHDFVARYGNSFPTGTFAYYYFSDSRSSVGGVELNGGYSFEFVSNNHQHLATLISDHNLILDRFEQRVPLLHIRRATIPALCELPPTRSKRSGGPFKLLWASRLDPEKRPDLLHLIAEELDLTGLRYELDIFGSAAFSTFDTSQFRVRSNVHYRGSFDGFQTLRTQDYSAFIYTTAFDGLPNVILEAMASGLPVIAPAIGGIGERVHSTNGRLIEPSTDDRELAKRYASAVAEVAESDFVHMGMAGRELIASLHSEPAFLIALASAFDSIT